MIRRTRGATAAAAITLAASPVFAIGMGAAVAAPSGTTVVLNNLRRTCDGNRLAFQPAGPRVNFAYGSAIIRTTGAGTVVAEVHLVNTNAPGTHYDVGLIQVPRPTSSPCGPGDPGTAFVGLDIDATGLATTTVQDSIRSGTTGAWVVVQRPSEHSQDSAEYYSSDMVVPI